MKNYKILLTIIIALGLVACNEDSPSPKVQPVVAEKEKKENESNKKTSEEESKRIKKEEKELAEAERKMGLFSKNNPLPKGEDLDVYVQIINHVNRIKVEFTNYTEKERYIKSLLEDVKQGKAKYDFTLNELSLKHIIDEDGIILIEDKKALKMVDKILAGKEDFLNYRSVISNHIINTHELNKKCSGDSVNKNIVGICENTIELNNNLTIVASFYSHRFKQEDILSDSYGVNTSVLMQDALVVLEYFKVTIPKVYTEEDLLSKENVVMHYATNSLDLSLKNMKLEKYMKDSNDFMKMFLETRAVWHVLPKIFNKHRASLYKFNKNKEEFTDEESIALFEEIGRDILGEVLFLPVTNPSDYFESYAKGVRYDYNLIGEYESGALKYFGGYATEIYVNLLKNNVTDLEAFKMAFEKIILENKGMSGLTLKKITESLSALKTSDVLDYQKKNGRMDDVMDGKTQNLKFIPDTN